MTQDQKQNNNLRLNPFDIIILVTVIFSFTGYVFARTDKIPLNNIIEKKENIVIKILIPDVFNESMLFNAGEVAAITIRNKPYKGLTIIKSESKPKLAIVQDRTGSYKTIKDPTKQNIQDFIVTFRDSALKTKDGYVTSGNKIKIGNQIELEGFNYRLTGKVIDIRALGETK